MQAFKGNYFITFLYHGSLYLTFNIDTQNNTVDTSSCLRSCDMLALRLDSTRYSIPSNSIQTNLQIGILTFLTFRNNLKKILLSEIGKLNLM